MIFVNRLQAIKHYRDEAFRVDTTLQIYVTNVERKKKQLIEKNGLTDDVRFHLEILDFNMKNRIRHDMGLLRELKSNIDWNEKELAKERALTSFSRESTMLVGSLGLKSQSSHDNVEVD